MPNLARAKAAEDAADFISKRIIQIYQLRETFGGHPPLVTSPYDADFTAWWFEVRSLDFLFREIHYKKDL